MKTLAIQRIPGTKAFSLVTGALQAAVVLTAWLTGALLTAAPLRAAIIFTGGTGETVYGVTSYGPPTPGVPTYIFNNVTGAFDILSSPGGTFLTANPVVGNNIFDTGPQVIPFFSFQIGGGNINGPFGAGTTVVTGVGTSFSLQDLGPGGGSASYMITSWDSTFVVDAGGFADTIGAYLSIAGRDFTQTDSAVAALITQWSINGGPFVFLPQMVLAANGLNLPGVAIGGSGAALINVNGFFDGVAIDNLGFQILAPGTTIEAITTLTVYADPASIESIDIRLNPALALTGTSVPGFSIANTAAVPEPATLALFALGLATLGFARRRMLS